MTRRRWQVLAAVSGLILFAMALITFRLLYGDIVLSQGLPPSPFRGLSEETRLTIEQLLMLPVGMLVLVFIRLFVGLPTIGTFMPVLIGLAFLELGVATGLVLFLSVILIGLVFRYLLSSIRLLLVPRLAAIFILLVILLIGLAYFIDLFDWSISLGVSVLPLVIITMTIERLFVAMEEVGPKEAFFQLCGSMLCAVLTCLAMSWNTLSSLLFAFPELLLVFLALNILAGRYLGFRLSEYIRFKSVGK